jgi:K+-transporting ATPase ATPase C chain
MFKEAIRHIRTATTLLFMLMFLTGVLYPLTVTVLAQYLFPWQANGSIIKQEGQAIGSVLIGQANYLPEYFWGRPSATTPFPYNGASSSGSNSGPSNPEFLATVQARITALKKMDPQNKQPIPVDLVTASGSGLDPEISPQAAFYQVPRVARERRVSEPVLNALIEDHIKNRTFGLLGEPRINVMKLNTALDNLRTNNGKPAAKP